MGKKVKCSSCNDTKKITITCFKCGGRGCGSCNNGYMTRTCPFC